MSSLWNIQIFKYTPYCNCKPGLQSTDRHCSITGRYHIRSYRGPTDAAKLLSSEINRLLNVLKTKPSLDLFFHCIPLNLLAKYLYDTQNNWYRVCSTHSEMMTWVSFYRRCMKHGLLWEQQHSIIWTGIPSALTCLLPSKCALLVKPGQQKRWESARPCTNTKSFGERKANACHLLDYLLCLSRRDVEQK